MTTYFLADRIPYEQRKALGIQDSELAGHLPSIGALNKIIRATPTGETRCPKRGEWFLSGAVPQGYFASNDLMHPYRILKLVRVKTETKVIETYEELG